MALVLSDKINFRTKKIMERYYIMINGPIHQKDIVILNVHAPNNTATRYMKQKIKKLKGEIEKFHSFFWWRLRHPLSTIERQKINKI